MTLQELRFFSIYLSKINPWDQSTRLVRFPLDDFRRIMGLGAGENITHFRSTIRHILQQIVEVPNEKGTGYTAFQLFKRAKVEKDENDEWYVEFDAHDDALPLMFDFKNRYFKYELWNALRLKSPNQVRMYEILKQYEGLGKRELTIAELRELLGIGKNEYDRWDNFKRKVLDSCQQALKETTDICYTYERGKTGKGGKWLTIIFRIQKNEDHIDQLTLDEFIEMQPAADPIVVDDEFFSTEICREPEQQLSLDSDAEDNCCDADRSTVDFLHGACDGEFDLDQINALFQMICTWTIADFPNCPNPELGIQRARYHYLAELYAKMVIESRRKTIKNRFAYVVGMIESDRKQLRE